MSYRRTLTRIYARILLLVLGSFSMLGFAGSPIFSMQFLLGATNFSNSLGLYSPPEEHLINITNQSSTQMTSMLYLLPRTFSIDPRNTTCGNTLAAKKSCTLAVYFTPNTIGRFKGQLQVCAANGIWCSTFPTPFDITVENKTLVSENCNSIASRPFSVLDCQSSYTYANNFASLFKRVLEVSESTVNQFYYFQHQPSASETTTECLSASQSGVNLNANIHGGGVSLCALMGLATSNASSTDNAMLNKLFPPYLNFLLGTSYPITANTNPLDDLSQLESDFATTTMDPFVRNLGEQGYINFLSSYNIEQLGADYRYENCGSQVTCPSIYYLPYSATGSLTTDLSVWPPEIPDYWGISGGGGSGAGYQIQAFKPGSATHYTLFSGGGGGGGGNTTPEVITGSSLVDMINTGSGGGGGSQFSDCYVVNSENLNGLGLGAGTGSGLSTVQNSTVTYVAPPAVDYSYYPPVSHPAWNTNTILTQYTQNLQYLLTELIPLLYRKGYTIAVMGGGGGGAGLEFLNSHGEEYNPHPVSIGYGFNFCYLFNVNHQYSSSDCISSSSTTNALGASSQDLDTLIYQNVGSFYNDGMSIAVLPQNCNGYTDFNCTCKVQHAYVICQLSNLLLANHYTAADIPSWLLNPHCNDSQQDMVTTAQLLDSYSFNSGQAATNCEKAVEDFIQANAQTTCKAPWT